jgi:hypothetical protein
VILAGTCLCAGCSNFAEKHYFAAVDKHNHPINYFRLTVTGYTFLSSSRYVSGYFDEDAVNQYFGTISQPSGATFVGLDPASGGKADGGASAPGGGSGASGASTTTTTKVATSPDGTAPAAGKSKTGPSVKTAPLGGTPAGRGAALILLLSSNSDAIAENIGSLSESSQTLAAVSMLANKEKFQAVTSAQGALAEEEARGAAIDSLVGGVLNGLDQQDAATAEAKLLAVLNNIASQYGNDVAFTDFKSGADWLNRKRATLLRPQ